MSKVPLTVRGADNLRAELTELKQVARPRVIAAIAEARAHGDLKENAEYHAAREQQSSTKKRLTPSTPSRSSAMMKRISSRG
jgi:transcription elongation factor GreA